MLQKSKARIADIFRIHPLLAKNMPDAPGALSAPEPTHWIPANKLWRVGKFHHFA
jgi:hypothetical protein